LEVAYPFFAIVFLFPVVRMNPEQGPGREVREGFSSVSLLYRISGMRDACADCVSRWPARVFRVSAVFLQA